MRHPNIGIVTVSSGSGTPAGRPGAHRPQREPGRAGLRIPRPQYSPGLGPCADTRTGRCRALAAYVLCTDTKMELRHDIRDCLYCLEFVVALGAQTGPVTLQVRFSCVCDKSDRTSGFLRLCRYYARMCVLGELNCR